MTLPPEYLPESSDDQDLHRYLVELRHTVYAHTDRASGRKASTALTSEDGEVVMVEFARSGFRSLVIRLSQRSTYSGVRRVTFVARPSGSRRSSEVSEPNSGVPSRTPIRIAGLFPPLASR